MANNRRDDIRDPELDDDVPRAKTRWHGRAVEVTARLIPRYLWTTASIDVFLDGQYILRTGGQMKAVGSSSAEFHLDGSVHSVELSWGAAQGFSFPYQLWIDGAKVVVSEVAVENAAFIVIPLLIVASPIWVALLVKLH
jgi:hypothetical protein